MAKRKDILNATLKALIAGAETSTGIKIAATFISELASLPEDKQEALAGFSQEQFTELLTQSELATGNAAEAAVGTEQIKALIEELIKKVDNINDKLETNNGSILETEVSVTINIHNNNYYLPETEEIRKQPSINKLWDKGLRASNAKEYELAAECFSQIIDIKPFAEAYSNWGNALSDKAKSKKGSEAEDLFREACEKQEKATQIKPDAFLAYSNWGWAFTEQAIRKEGAESDKLFRQSCEKFEKSIQIKPDFHKAYNNWGNTLMYWAIRKESNERQQLFQQAEEKLLKAESIKTALGAYNLACLYAILGRKEDCKKWLKVKEQAGTLPSREHAMNDAALAIVRHEVWFKEIRWFGE